MLTPDLFVLRRIAVVSICHDEQSPTPTARRLLERPGRRGHDGANRNGNKLPSGALNPKGSCLLEVPTTDAVEMKAFGCCRAVRGLERANDGLRWPRRVGLQPGA